MSDTEHLTDARLGRRQARLGRVARPVQEFIATEAASGIVLLAAGLFALVWANSLWSDQYVDLLETHLVLDIGLLRIDESLHFWVNDVAMVVFFFLVGMEIKREVVLGELRGPRRLAVPAAAALGGMIVPLALFMLIAQGPEAREGWGIPMATDIAFALGMMALLSDRVPVGLKVLLLATAIFDDLATVFVIAVFYTEGFAIGPFALGLAFLAGAFVLRQLGVQRVPIYIAIGVAAWAAIIESGVHPTTVGVALGVMTPWRPWSRPEGVQEAVTGLAQRYGAAAGDGAIDREHRRDAVIRMRDVSWHAVAPLDRLEHELHPWVALMIVPVFAWANAGVDLGGGVFGEAIGSSLTWAIIVALVIGKPAGVLLGYLIAVRLGGRASAGITWRDVLGMGILAGIGFTVALFVTDLAFVDETLVAGAKVGVLLASLVAAVAGLAVLRLLGHRHHTPGHPVSDD